MIFSISNNNSWTKLCPLQDIQVFIDSAMNTNDFLGGSVDEWLRTESNGSLPLGNRVWATFTFLLTIFKDFYCINE